MTHKLWVTSLGTVGTTLASVSHHGTSIGVENLGDLSTGHKILHNEKFISKIQIIVIAKYNLFYHRYPLPKV